MFSHVSPRRVKAGYESTSEQVTAGLPQGAQGSGLELGQRFRHTVKGCTPAAVHVYKALDACGHRCRSVRLEPETGDSRFRLDRIKPNMFHKRKALDCKMWRTIKKLFDLRQCDNSLS